VDEYPTAADLTARGVLFFYKEGQPRVKLDAADAATRAAFAAEVARRTDLFDTQSRARGVPVHHARLTDAPPPRHGACECCGDPLLVYRRDGRAPCEGARGGTCMLCVAAIRAVLRRRGARL